MCIMWRNFDGQKIEVVLKCIFYAILIDEKSMQVRPTFSMYFWKRKYIVYFDISFW